MTLPLSSLSTSIVSLQIVAAVEAAAANANAKATTSVTTQFKLLGTL